MPAPLGNDRWNIAYAADGDQVEMDAPADYNPWIYNYERWTPSIHMPRWASRITLEIVSVRVERLNEISGSDAAAEGVQFRALGSGVPLKGNIWKQNIDKFCALWESINGAGSWDANPWVWVVEFKVVPQ